MASILEKIVATKRKEIDNAKNCISIDSLRDQLDEAPAVRDFLGAIESDDNVSLIAEVKKASPSKGVIRDDFEPISIAKTYELSGATCVSVLTDENYFQGHLKYLKDIRRHVEIPILRKDFVVDAYQVYEARAAGADAVLLIAECLTAEDLKSLHETIVDLNMTPLVELYDPENLNAVLDTGARLIGINNRDLRTFETDLEHCMRLREQIPSDVLVVAESGILTANDVARIKRAKLNAMLVGESLMRQEDIGNAVQSLLAER